MAERHGYEKLARNLKLTKPKRPPVTFAADMTRRGLGMCHSVCISFCFAVAANIRLSYAGLDTPPLPEFDVGTYSVLGGMLIELTHTKTERLTNEDLNPGRLSGGDCITNCAGVVVTCTNLPP